MLSKEEIEKAKENINDYIHDWLDSSTNEDGYEINSIDNDSMYFINNIQTLLQYIDQLEQENKQLKIAYKLMENEAMKDGLEERNKQNKIIDEMAKAISGGILRKEQWCPLLSKEGGCHANDTCLQCLKQYFEKKVEEK